MTQPKTLQAKIDQAGSPMKALWRPGAPPWHPPVVAREFVGWAKEQSASYQAVTLSDLSFHMRDLVVEGPDAKRLLARCSINNYEKFVDGQAKQFVAVTENGHAIADGILLRVRSDKYVLTGPSSSQNWVLFNAQCGNFDVKFVDNPSADYFKGPQMFFRFQIQGPKALDLVAKVFGGPLPHTKFFHSTEVKLGGRTFRALRHGMAGQAGYEFIGDHGDHQLVRDAFMSAGEEFGLVPIGAFAYATNNLESGWIPTPVAGIYTDAKLRTYREWLSAFTYEANHPLHGSYFSENIEDYYSLPHELGYGRLIDLEHDFVGRDALAKVRDDDNLRTKVTLVLDPAEAKRLLGEPNGYFLSNAIYRVEANGRLVGTGWGASHQARRGTVLALALINKSHAATGTVVEFIYGEHPGPGTDPHADLGFQRIRATVAPSPYDAYARTEYRKN
jgi:vanillate/3-O-methylgallate O-demethylase